MDLTINDDACVQGRAVFRAVSNRTAYAVLVLDDCAALSNAAAHAAFLIALST